MPMNSRILFTAQVRKGATLAEPPTKGTAPGLDIDIVEQSYVEREWLLCRDLSWLSCLGGAEASLASLGGTRSRPRRR